MIERDQYKVPKHQTEYRGRKKDSSFDEGTLAIINYNAITPHRARVIRTSFVTPRLPRDFLISRIEEAGA